MNHSNRPLISAVVEFVGGYFFLLGLGWIFAGDWGMGLILLVGYLFLLSVLGGLVHLTGGCLAPVAGIIYIVVPIISAIRVYQWANDRWW